MSNVNTLDRILAAMEGDSAVTPKTASDNTPAPASRSPEERMLETVRALTQKQASAAPEDDAVSALQKIASQAADLENELFLKQAEQAGEVFCDGFMRRFAQYDGAVAAGTKTASAQDMQKIAEEAYAKGQADLEKQAADAYEAGYNAQLQQIHKIASEIHVAGQQSARNVLAALKQEKAAAAVAR